MSNVDPTGMTTVGRWLQIYVASGENFGGCTEDGVTLPCSQLNNSGATNVPGTCVYLNDSGTGLDQNGTDNNSNSSECGDHGGYFAPGTVNLSAISINSDGGLDPGTESAVTFGIGSVDGTLYSLTVFAPGALGAFGVAPSQFLTPDQCNQMNQGLTRGTLAGSVGIAAVTGSLTGPVTGFLVGVGTAYLSTQAQVSVNQNLCGGPPF